MKRDPHILSQVVLRCWTLTITLVVGFQFGPQLFAHRPSAPVVYCADQNISDDTCKAGERLEPRAAGGSFFDRLAPAHPSCPTGAVSGADAAGTLGHLFSDDRSDVQRLPIVKHVPRMERGDPPRT
jgi:hypothetical protein